jgi:hypothetical protein
MSFYVPFERAEEQSCIEVPGASMFEQSIFDCELRSTLNYRAAMRVCEARVMGVPFLLGTFLWAKTNLPGANLNMRSMARRANHRDVICKSTSPAGATNSPGANLHERSEPEG